MTIEVKQFSILQRYKGLDLVPHPAIVQGAITQFTPVLQAERSEFTVPISNDYDATLRLYGRSKDTYGYTVRDKDDNVVYSGACVLVDHAVKLLKPKDSVYLGSGYHVHETILDNPE